MKQTLSRLLPVLVSCIASVSTASTVIQFYEPYGAGIPDNLANSGGVPTNGMAWGIVVDTAGDGFALSGTQYDAYTGGVGVAGFFSAGGSVTNDYFIPGQGTTVDASGLYAAGDAGDTPGNGSIITDLIVDYTNGVSTGDAFRLVWFQSNTSAGSKYGLLSDPSFTMVADQSGNSYSNYAAAFGGNDPIRSASNTFQGVSPIPEPSRALLLGFGAMGMVFRRRRDRKA